MMKDYVRESYSASKEWAELVLVNTAAEGMRLLVSGKHDAMLINKVVGLHTLHMLELSNVKALTARAGFKQKFAFAVHEGKSELLMKINEAFAVIKANKVYDAIYETWFGVYDVKVVSLFDILKYLIPIILIFISITAYNFYLRRSQLKLSDSAKIALGERLKNILEGTRSGTWEWNVQTGETTFNDRWASIIGYELRELQPTSIETWIKFVHPDDAKLSEELLEKHFSGELPYYECEARMRHKDGHWIWVLDRGKVTKWNPDGKPLEMSGTHQDVTDHKQIENKLKESEERLALAMMGTQDGLWDWNLLNDKVYFSPQWKSMLGYEDSEITNDFSEWQSLLHREDLKSALSNIQYFLNNKAVNYSSEFRMQHKDGHYINILSRAFAVEGSDGKITRLVGTHVDISERKLAEEEIRVLAFNDPLTQLPNRRLLVDRLSHALAASARSGQRGALIIMDLDHFKTLNDTLGHNVGDELLQQVAARLTANVREGDTVSRFGGDEFVILLEGLSEENIEAAAHTKDVAEKILHALNQPYQLGVDEHRSTPSIGAIVFNGHEETSEELLKQADIAMYQSKAAGRNTLRFFNQTMQEVITARVDMENELRKAIHHKQFQLHYQIQLDNNGQALGAEALIRWIHPERGMISPFDFIPLAEDTGLILPIGQWVLDTACAQLKAWQQNPLTQDLILAVNVSAKQFHQDNFVAQVLATIARHDINAARLKLELTESMLVTDIGDIITKMDTLSKIGIQFSLDDFGTGYSSLQYLKRLPLNQLKIDQAFVRELVTDANDRAIVRTIISMANGLNINVIAEGVETVEQRQYLLDNGCMHYQGYLFSKPVPIDEFEALLKKD
jgi:diguanylate cyclase (GGDEF)-like protein/PAS domain S-box-containing protein